MKAQKHGYNVLMALAIPAVVAVALLNLGVIADASCVLYWEPGELACKQANAQGHFQYDQDTQWGSAGKGQWAVTQAVQWPMGSNIHNVGCNPSSTQVTDGGGVTNDHILTTCQGDLIDTGLDGSSRLNAWDGTGSGGLPECTGSHNVDIKKANGPGC